MYFLFHIHIFIPLHSASLLISRASIYLWYIRAVPMKETSSFYNIGYRTKKVLFSNPWFIWVITIFSFSLPTLSFPPMGVRYELSRNWWFLPNDDFMVSWCIGSRVDLVSSWRNQVYDFCSLSSLITLPCQHFAYVASHLMRIETIINAPLELPLDF